MTMDENPLEKKDMIVCGGLDIYVVVPFAALVAYDVSVVSLCCSLWLLRRSLVRLDETLQAGRMKRYLLERVAVWREGGQGIAFWSNKRIRRQE